jgi:hypothetical protein
MDEYFKATYMSDRVIETRVRLCQLHYKMEEMDAAALDSLAIKVGREVVKLHQQGMESHVSITSESILDPDLIGMETRIYKGVVSPRQKPQMKVESADEFMLAVRSRGSLKKKLTAWQRFKQSAWQSLTRNFDGED